MLSRVLARVARRQTPSACPPVSTEIPPVLRDLAALRASRPRVMRRELFAALLVGYLRDEGFTGWHLPEDLDEVAEWLYRRHDIEPLPASQMREAVAMLAGVRHQRLRLLDRPELATIRIRLKARGQKVDRAWLYHIADEHPASVTVLDELPDRPATAEPPENGRPGRAATRSGGGQPPAKAGKSKKHRTIGDVRHASGTTCTPERQATASGLVPERQTKRAA